MKLKKAIWMAAVVLCAGVMLVSAVQILIPMRNYHEAGQEYAALRRQHAPDMAGGADVQEPAPDAPPDLSAVNPDYVGWLQVTGSAIDYPVARGQDNEKYLHTTFSGEENPVGAIFMDHTLVEGFDSPHTILYGHNVKDGSMFGGLYHYLDRDYLEENPAIHITTAAGDTLEYTIFAARKTTTQDTAYRLDFPGAEDFAIFAAGLGAPAGAEHLLTLSTCAGGGDRDERILVHAARG